MLLIGGAIYLTVMAAQGGVVFATAWLALWLMKRRSIVAKVLAMAVSWAAWIAFTLAAYILPGGSGGLMEGFGLVLVLCVTATVSTVAYLAVWILWPHVVKKPAPDTSSVF
jgi:hypothetical protein